MSKTTIEICTIIKGQGLTAIGAVERAVRHGHCSINGERRRVQSNYTFDAYVIARSLGTQTPPDISLRP